jgi:hypothetical protein
MALDYFGKQKMSLSPIMRRTISLNSGGIYDENAKIFARACGGTDRIYRIRRE